jgi:hypothetical protein
MYLLLSLLGTAIGLSVSSRVEGEELGIGAAIYATFVTLLSLFVGGCVTSRCAVGETKGEAVIHGTVLWGVLFAMLLCLMAGGIQLGFSAMVGAANTPTGRDVAARVNEDDLRARGMTAEQIAEELREAAKDPAATRAAWWAFGGVLLSVLAAVAGAVTGSGTNIVALRHSERIAVPHGDHVHVVRTETVENVTPRK